MGEALKESLTCLWAEKFIGFKQSLVNYQDKILFVVGGQYALKSELEEGCQYELDKENVCFDTDYEHMWETHQEGGESVYYYDTISQTWFKGPNMTHKRLDDHRACVLGQKLYVFGGQFGTEANSSIEKLDVNKLINDGPTMVDWTLIKLKSNSFTLGKKSIVASLCNHEIMILSRYSHYDTSTDWQEQFYRRRGRSDVNNVSLFDVNTNKVKRCETVRWNPTDLFKVNARYIDTRDGHIVATIKKDLSNEEDEDSSMTERAIDSWVQDDLSLIFISQWRDSNKYTCEVVFDDDE